MDPLPIPEPPPIPPASPKKPFPVVGIFITIFFLTLVGLIFYQQLQIQKLSQIEPTVTPTLAPTLPPDQTASWKTYTNQKLGFTLKYPPTVEISQEYNDENNRVTEFQGDEIKFDVMLRKSGNISLDNYYFMDNQILRTASLGGKNSNVYAQDISNINCINDGSGPSCPVSFIAYVAESGSDIYHVSFYGDNQLSDLENQILSTFAFVN